MKGLDVCYKNYLTRDLGQAVTQNPLFLVNLLCIHKAVRMMLLMNKWLSTLKKNI